MLGFLEEYTSILQLNVALKMSLPYKKILTTGATSGIGLSMATCFIKTYDISVVAVGRRQDRLDAIVQEHGDKASAMSFDVSNVQQIPEFVKRYGLFALETIRSKVEK
jgi:NADP-dependent 3-hydroxy acid dehydrogenase YdfG